LANLLTSFQTK